MKTERLKDRVTVGVAKIERPSEEHCHREAWSHRERNTIDEHREIETDVQGETKRLRYKEIEIEIISDRVAEHGDMEKHGDIERWR